MNERIKELAKQARQIGEYVNYGQIRLSHEQFEQKFAELIVKECARVDSEENNPDHVDGETYNQTILQHFGVEE